MNKILIEKIKTQAGDYMERICKEQPDPSHDILHVRRVVKLAESLCKSEKGSLEVVVPAAYLHDCVCVSKTDKRREKASSLSAEKAVVLLKEWGLADESILSRIHHAILSHSFSAGVKAESLEAQIVQDADRLDAMGAIGIARTLAFSGVVKRPIYNEKDPFCKKRSPDDSTNTLDHFFIKLLKLQEKLNTKSAKEEGALRLESMKAYLLSLKRELET